MPKILRRWTAEEDQLLISCYDAANLSMSMADGELAAKLHRNVMAIAQRRYELRLLKPKWRKNNYVPTQEEIAVACESVRQNWKDYDWQSRLADDHAKTKPVVVPGYAIQIKTHGLSEYLPTEVID